MKFAEAAEQLRLARLEGKRLSFSTPGEHFNIGVNDSFFWWEYICCDPDCGHGDFETYATVEDLIKEHGRLSVEFDNNWT